MRGQVHVSCRYIHIVYKMHVNVGSCLSEYKIMFPTCIIFVATHGRYFYVRKCAYLFFG